MEKKNTIIMCIKTLLPLIILMFIILINIIYEINNQKKEELAVAEINDARELQVLDEEQNITSRGLRAGERALEELEEIVEIEEVKTTPIEEVEISMDMDLTVRTGLSREDFIKLMTDCKQDKSGFFEENAGLIYDVCETNSINEIFFVGLIAAESGWSIVQNHRNTYNYISLMSKSGLIKFSSVEDGMTKAAETLHNKYLTPGGVFYYGPTLAGVKTKFCPASTTWTGLVFKCMSQALAK